MRGIFIKSAFGGKIRVFHEKSFAERLYFCSDKAHFYAEPTRSLAESTLHKFNISLLLDLTIQCYNSVAGQDKESGATARP